MNARYGGDAMVCRRREYLRMTRAEIREFGRGQVIQGAFQHRSGRVIALGRLVLGAVFMFAIWLDPTQPTRLTGYAYGLLALYVLAAAAYLAATWDDWWLECRLAFPAHIVDIAVFGVMVYLTEGYTSPFFTFFVFILLSATVKWGWRETAMTSAAVTLVFFVAGLAALEWGSGEIELQRMLFRSSYLVVLSLVLIWFGVNQRAFGRGDSAPAELIDPERPSSPPIAKATAFAAGRLGTPHLVFAWWDREEPWVTVAQRHGDALREERLGPIDPPVSGPEADAPFLFDLDKERTLRLGEDGRRRLSRGPVPVDREFARRFDLRAGLAIPVRSDLFEGSLFAVDVPGLCADDLAIARDVAAELSAAFERTSAIALFEENAATRTRLSLARDLHDSVVQLLAGTSFRLEGMRNAVRSNRDIEPDIDALQQELAAEQRELRSFIAQLRRRPERSESPDLKGALEQLAGRLARQWGIECTLQRCPERLRPPEATAHAVHQLLREAVANAVRHGKASRVSVSADSGETGLSLVVADNGSGFGAGAPGEPKAKPWSLHERVQELGGTISLHSTGEGSRIIVSLPYEDRS